MTPIDTTALVAWVKEQQEYARRAAGTKRPSHYPQRLYHNRVAILEAILTRLTAAPTAWQNISTAPKDGTRALLWWTTRGASSGYFQADENGVGWRGDMDLCVPRDQHRCTHWQPLPDAPQTSEGQ